jgi:hypothetical protein
MTDDVAAHGMDSVSIDVFVETLILLRETPDERGVLFERF